MVGWNLVQNLAASKQASGIDRERKRKQDLWQKGREGGTWQFGMQPQTGQRGTTGQNQGTRFKRDKRFCELTGEGGKAWLTGE